MSVSRYHVCDSPDYSGVTDDDAYVAVSDWIEGNVTGHSSMPSEDADGCPGWKPKPGAHVRDLLPLSPHVAAVVPEVPDANPYVHTFVTDPTLPDAITTLDELHAQAIRATGNVGWRGHLPLCRGPGGTVARRLRRLVRGRR